MGQKIILLNPTARDSGREAFQDRQCITRPPWGCKSMRVSLWELEVVLPYPEKLFLTYNSQINGVSASFLIDTGTAISLQYTLKKLLVTHQNLFFKFYHHHFCFFQSSRCNGNAHFGIVYRFVSVSNHKIDHAKKWALVTRKQKKSNKTQISNYHDVSMHKV